MNNFRIAGFVQCIQQSRKMLIYMLALNGCLRYVRCRKDVQMCSSPVGSCWLYLPWPSCTVIHVGYASSSTLIIELWCHHPIWTCSYHNHSIVMPSCSASYVLRPASLSDVLKEYTTLSRHLNTYHPFWEITTSFVKSFELRINSLLLNTGFGYQYRDSNVSGGKLSSTCRDAGICVAVYLYLKANHYSNIDQYKERC